MKFSSAHQQYLRSFLRYTSQCMANVLGGTEEQMCTYLESDLMDFLFHLAIKDGDVPLPTRTAIADFFGYTFTPQQWNDHKLTHEIPCSAMVSRVPYSYALLLQAENTSSFEGGTKSFVEAADSLSRLLATGAAGVALLANRRNAYLNMLCDYAAAQLKKSWPSRVLANRVQEDKADASRFFGFAPSPRVVSSLRDSIEALVRCGKRACPQAPPMSEQDLRAALRQLWTRLAAADGPINAAEALCIREYLKCHVESLYLTHALKKESAGSLPPAVRKVLDALRKMGDTDYETAADMAHIFIDLYDGAAPLILQADSPTNAREEQACATLRHAIIAYLEADA